MKRAMMLLLIVSFCLIGTVVAMQEKQDKSANQNSEKNVQQNSENSSEQSSDKASGEVKKKAAVALVEAFAKNDFDYAIGQFSDEMKKAVPKEQLAQIWQSILQQGGKFKQIGEIKQNKIPNGDLFLVYCEFEKISLIARMAINDDNKIIGLYFDPALAAKNNYLPPSYADSNTFTETEVKIGTGEWVLPATLTLPKGDGPFPVVVLVHGSGPNDRDETVGPNKPFRDIAQGLASQKIAVLRYDKRTKIYGLKLLQIKNFTAKDEVTDDVIAATDLLRKTKGIDAKRIYVLGHSLGGTLIPRIGKADKDIAGLIILAGATRPLEDLVLEQFNYIYSLDGQLSDDEKATIAKLKIEVEKVKALKNEDSGMALGLPVSYWLDLKDYRAADAAKDIKQRMFILQGERDYQVTMVDFNNWKSALTDRKDVQFKSYAKLNHLFIAGEGKSAPTEYQQASHVEKQVIDDIKEWITNK